MNRRWQGRLAYFLQHTLLRRKLLLATGLPQAMRLWVRVPDDVGRRIYKYGTHEPASLAFLETHSPPEPEGLVVDAGANLGWYSVLAARLGWGAAGILAFEPDPDNHALLAENLALNGLTTARALPLALSDHDGSAVLHRYHAGNLGRHSLRPQRLDAGSVSVPVRTLDGVLAEMGLGSTRITLLKVDVEGFEPELVRGARQAVARTDLLLLEYSPIYYSESAAQQMLATLAAVGLGPRLFTGGAWRMTSPTKLLALTQQVDTLWLRDA